MADEENSDEDSDSETSPPPIDPRAREISIAVRIAGGAAAFGALLTLVIVWNRLSITDPDRLLRIASDEYAMGRPSNAAKLAEQIELSDDDEVNPKDQFREFFVGAGRAAAAKSLENPNRRNAEMLLAIPHLEHCKEIGFPTGREADGYRLLGQAYLYTGHYAKAVAALETAVKMSPTQHRELLPQLVHCQLIVKESSPIDALFSVDQYLRLPNINRTQRTEGRLLRGRSLVALKRWPEARHEFRKVIASTDLLKSRQQARLLEAASHVAEALEVRKQQLPSEPLPARYSETVEDALATLKSLKRTVNHPSLATEAGLWTARAYRCLDKPNQALDHLTSVRQSRPFSAKGIAAGVEEFEILADQLRALEAIQTIRYLVREIGDPDSYDGRLLPLDQFQNRIVAAIKDFSDAEMFETTIKLSRSLPPVFDIDDALVVEATAYASWAAAIQMKHRLDTSKAKVAIDAQIRKHFQKAGDAFLAAAKVRFTTDEYASTLWSAIEAYQNGRNFVVTVGLLKKYLENEHRKRQPQGLVYLGRAYLALGDMRAVIEPLRDCIELHPRDPLRYEARFLSAQAYSELEDLEPAKELLDINLHDGGLAPQSPMWRDSLQLLGELLYRESYQTHLALAAKEFSDGQRTLTPEIIDTYRKNQKRLSHTIRVLSESAIREGALVDRGILKDELAIRKAIRRAQTAHYYTAHAEQLAAYWPGKEAVLPDVLDAARRKLRRQHRKHLATAMSGYKKVKQKLAAENENRELDPFETSLLRNCYMNEADLLRELGQLKEAAKAYREISLKYIHHPIALEAMLGQAHCLKEMGKEASSRRLILLAEKTLDRISEEWDNHFDKTTRYNRDQWKQLLAWMGQQNQLIPK